MPDDKIIDIRTRKPPVVSGDVMAAAQQLVEITDARDIAGLIGALLHDSQGIPLLLGAPDTPEVREAIWEIFEDAATQLDHLADSFKPTNDNDF